MKNTDKLKNIDKEDKDKQIKIDFDSLPSAGYIREDGVTVVTTEWEWEE